MIKNRKLTLEQRITRLERLLQCDNKSCNKHMKFEAHEALDIDGDVITQFSWVIDADGEKWKVIKVAPLDVMLNKASFDNRREVSEYINDNHLYDRNLMQRTVVLMRSDDGTQVLCLEPEILEIV